jgi:hypothetical protein
VRAKRPENVNFLFKASPRKTGRGHESARRTNNVIVAIYTAPTCFFGAEPEITITSMRYADKLMQWLTLYAEPVLGLWQQ